MLTEAPTYDELYRNFRWDIPERFNMATACCDRHADGTNRLALVYVDEGGATTHTSFDEVAEQSRRFANVLKADGLSRGDRVAVLLSQSLELPIAHLAAFRSGMISIPLFALFGEDALEFRLSNSEAKAIVTDEGGWEKLAKIRDRLPALKNVYIVGDKTPAGTKPFWASLKAATPDLDRVREALEAIVKDGHRAGDVIQRIRQMATRTGPQKTQLDVNDVIREVVPLIGPEVRSHEVSLRLDLAPALPSVVADPLSISEARCYFGSSTAKRRAPSVMWPSVARTL